MKSLTLALMLLAISNQARATTDSLFYQIVGDTTLLWDAYAEETCESKYIDSVSLSADTVFAVRIDTSTREALCDCVYHFRFTVVGLPAGTYCAMYYGLYPRYPVKLKFKGSIQFTVPGSSAESLSSVLYQSRCGAPLIVDISAQPPGLPSSVRLESYPNPFNPDTRIEYTLPDSRQVSLQIFDILGRLVVTVEEGYEPAGV